MPTTYYSMGLMRAAESWRAIRTIRAEPNGRLNGVLQSDAARKREFHMALEQAQQQFDSASKIGYESRPLYLFTACPRQDVRWQPGVPYWEAALNISGKRRGTD